MADKSNTISSKFSNDGDQEHELRENISAFPRTSNSIVEKEVGGVPLSDVDTRTENKYDFHFWMVMAAFSMAFVGSQLVPLLFAALTYTISDDLHSGRNVTWLFSAQLIAVAATAPFVGTFADIYGKKLTAMLGVSLSILAMIVCGTTPTTAGFITGQSLAGISIAVQEMTAIAAISELVPVAKRGLFGAIFIGGFIPFAPGSLYGQLIAETNWRYNCLLLATWNVITLVMLGFFYKPPVRTKLQTTVTEDLNRLDLVGGALSVVSLCLGLLGLHWGGNDYPWSSAQVLCPVLIGLFFALLFGLWEKYGARHPLFPKKMVIAPRAFWMILFIILMAGINYVAILLFWPIQAVAVYGADHYHLGLYTLPYGTCILGGAIISALLLSVFSRHVQWVMLAFYVMQTVGTACMIVVDPKDVNTVWAPIVIGLLGAGGVLVPNQLIITAITADEYISTATALGLSLRLVGHVIGYELFYNRLLHNITTRATDIMLPVALQTGILDQALIQRVVLKMISTPWSIYAKTLTQIKTPAQYDLFANALIDLWSGSFPILYYISIAFGVSACVACCLIGNIAKHTDRPHVAARMH